LGSKREKIICLDDCLHPSNDQSINEQFSKTIFIIQKKTLIYIEWFRLAINFKFDC